MELYWHNVNKPTFLVASTSCPIVDTGAVEGKSRDVVTLPSVQTRPVHVAKAQGSLNDENTAPPSGVARGGGHGGHGPPKLLVVNFPINLRCYVLLGCRVINVILAINIGDSAFFDIAALVRQFGGLRHHQQTESIHWPPPN